MTDHLHPIDRVEDITPARLHHEARILAEQGRESPAKVIELCAERIAALEAEVERLQTQRTIFVDRINAAETALLSAKTERDCVTLDDWRQRSMYYEYEYFACSSFANKEIPKWQARAEAAEAKLAAVRKELEYAVSASIESNDVDVVAEDSIRDALDGLLKRTILYNDPCAGSYEVLDPPTTDELKALLREDGK